MVRKGPHKINEKISENMITCHNGCFDYGHNHHTCPFLYHLSDLYPLSDFYPYSSCDGGLHLCPYPHFGL